MKQPNADEPPIADPTPINFPQVKKRGGKVFCCLVLQKQPVKPVSVTTRNALRVTSVSRHIYFRNFGSRTTTSQHAVSIKKWTGHFFQATSLNEEGFTLHLGHDGAPYPSIEGQAEKKKLLVVVDVSGIHQLHIGWCQCEDSPGADIQLLRNLLFPASTLNPSTAFTFKLLRYFHIDSVECKTSALSFFSKLQRLTNESSPDTVPVGILAFCPSLLKSNCTCRTGTGS
jgi:hypothetical protein